MVLKDPPAKGHPDEEAYDPRYIDYFQRSHTLGRAPSLLGG